MADYKAWMRATADPSKMPSEIMPLIQKDSKSTFNLWLQSKKDVQKMVMTFNRTNSREKTVARGHRSVKKRDLAKEYDLTKLEPVLAKMEKAGQYTFDGLFPGDMTKIYYLIPKGTQWSKLVR